VNIAMADIIQVNWRYTINKSEVADCDVESKVYSPKEDGKYKLRACSVKKRLETEERCSKKRGPKPKTHSQKMSKYRRKTANARERMRMGEINVAFDKLKEKIPLPAVGLGRQKCEKLTKINLLHIAINYIRTLEDILESGEENVDIYPEKLMLNPFQPEEMDLPSDLYCVEESSNMAYSPPTPCRTSQKSPCSTSGSSSPDSGIQEDSDIEFPDWTELSSTLDLRSPGAPPQGSSQLSSNQSRLKQAGLHNQCGKVNPLRVYNKPSGITNTNTQTRPLFYNSTFKLNITKFPETKEKVTKSKPVTLTSRSPAASDRKAAFNNENELKVKTEVFLQNEFPPTKSQSDFLPSCSVSSLQLEQDDLFNELNTSIDSFDSIGDIDFCYDDPFRVF